MHQNLKMAASLYVACWLGISSADELQASISVPLRLTLENCNNKAQPSERLTCSLMLHDMLCYSSVMKSALAMDDDRKRCLSEADNPIFMGYLQDSLAAAQDNIELTHQLNAAYQQWQHNISTLSPLPLEPEYQYKVRRDANRQTLLFKIVSSPMEKIK